ncbi:MAG: four helix bundle protein [Kofleriaceae bacterium]
MLVLVFVPVHDSAKPAGTRAETPVMLDHEKLDVYRCAIEHLAFVFRALPRVPRGYASLTDQWRRAATSIPLNIAEASGKTTIADRNHTYAIARGEAMECAAIIDVTALLEIIPSDELAAAKELLVRVVSMLTKMCR